MKLNKIFYFELNDGDSWEPNTDGVVIAKNIVEARKYIKKILGKYDNILYFEIIGYTPLKERVL